MSSLRTFVAIDLSDRLKKNLIGLTKGIQASNPLVHWVSAANLHLTLCFLGDVELNQFHRVAKIVQESCQDASPFELVVSGLGGFPNSQNPRIIWAGVDGQQDQPCPALVDLNRSLVQNFLFHRFHPDNRAFRPHITLGRLPGKKQERQFCWASSSSKNGSDTDHSASSISPEVLQKTIGRQFVEEVKVMTSEASGPSVTYSVVATVKL